MSIAIAAAKIYVARIIGGAASPSVIDMAGEAILRAYADWQAAKFWTFLLKDTSSLTQVDSIVCTTGTHIIVPPSAGAFNFINPGQTVLATGGTATLVVPTTVTSVTRDVMGAITSVTLDNNFAGSTATQSLYFSIDIPLTAGTSDYNLPLDFSGSYSARLIDAAGAKNPLKFIDQRYWDKITGDQTLTGPPEAYTIFTAQSMGLTNFGPTRMRIFKVPDLSTYVVRLRYFRLFITTGPNIDVPDDYLYKFLDYARAILLETKKAQGDPGNFMRSTRDSFSQAQQNDEQPNDDDDNDSRLKSPYEGGEGRRPIVGNGMFDDL